MEKKIEFALEHLTPKCVNVVIKEFVEIDGQRVQLGSNQRVCYNNIPRDRARLQDVLPSEFVNAILAMWGETPIADDPQPPELWKRIVFPKSPSSSASPSVWQ